MEYLVGDFRAVEKQGLQERRPQPGRLELAADGAIANWGGEHEPVQLLHLYDGALHPRYFADARDPALAVREALKLHDDLDRGRDMRADGRFRHLESRHPHHL